MSCQMKHSWQVRRQDDQGCSPHGTSRNRQDAAGQGERADTFHVLKVWKAIAGEAGVPFFYASGTRTRSRRTSDASTLQAPSSRRCTSELALDGLVKEGSGSRTER